MAYIVGRKRQGKSGILTYYYLVEGYREDGRVKQRILEYLGTTPYQTKFSLDPTIGLKIAKILSNSDISKEEIRKKLGDLGLQIPPGELQEVKLVFNPPKKELFVYFHCTK